MQSLARASRGRAHKDMGSRLGFGNSAKIVNVGKAKAPVSSVEYCKQNQAQISCVIKQLYESEQREIENMIRFHAKMAR